MAERTCQTEAHRGKNFLAIAELIDPITGEILDGCTECAHVHKALDQEARRLYKLWSDPRLSRPPIIRFFDDPVNRPHYLQTEYRGGIPVQIICLGCGFTLVEDE